MSDHLTLVDWNDPDDHQATCSCGWVGPTQTAEDAAIADGLAHLDAFAVTPGE